jgi:hypothetical protein
LTALVERQQWIGTAVSKGRFELSAFHKNKKAAAKFATAS